MKKYRLLLPICALLACTGARSQNSVDTAFLECRYSFQYLKDTTDIDKTTDDYMILKIGAGASEYYSYSTFLVDSLQKADIDAGTPLEVMLQNRHTRYGKRGETYDILKLFSENKLIYTDKIASTRYRYEEPIPEFNWTMLQQTRDIWGFRCFCAECFFRGRKYFAWYTPDIAVNNGPWKFHGLPGLILEAYDERKEYVFEFAGIAHIRSAILQGDKNRFVKTDRVKFNKLLKHYLSDRLGFWRETKDIKFTISGASVPEPAKLKYDLMERY